VFSASIASYLTNELQHLSSGLVYAVVAALVFGEAALFIGFILPGETAVIVAGVVASQGRVNIVALCAIVVVAAIVGDSVGYEVGQRYGVRLMQLPILRKRHAALERALDGLNRRGPTYVFIGRFTAFLRAVMPGLAGMSDLSYQRFLVANALGALAWGVSFTLLGYYAGNALTSIERDSGWAATGLLVVVVVALIVVHFVRHRNTQRREALWRAQHPDADSVEGAE
jgi:membrane-associated protein